jgi:putative ABC transport system permease protein
MRITLPLARYPGRPDINVYFSRLIEEVQRLPGVRMAGAGSGLPLALASGDWSFDIEGRPRNGTRFPGAADWYVVTAGYFEALGVPLVRGRLPRASDDWEAAPVVFINEATARALFADEDPVGRRIRLSQSSGAEQPWRTIAGIVGDVRFRGLDTAPRPEMFIPHEQFVHFSATAQARAMTLVVKAGGDPMLLVPSIRGVMSGLDPEVPPAQIRDMESVMTRSVADRRLNVLLIGAFGVLALVLAAVGLYGVVAYSVAQRTRELGVRLALGASRTSVLRLVVSEGARLVLVGSALGVAAALALSAPLSTLLFDVHPRDVAVLATAPALLLLVGMAASYIPARRATRVDPVVALRAE